MRCISGLVSWSGLFAAFLLLVSVVCVSGDENCFAQNGTDIDFKGTCTSASVATIEVNSESFIAVLDYKPPGLIGSEVPFGLNVSGCQLVDPNIQDFSIKSVKAATLFVDEVSYTFPATITVNGSLATIHGSNGNDRSICSDAQLDQTDSGSFTSNISIDLKGKEISPFSMKIKDATLYVPPTSYQGANTATIGIIFGGIVAVVLAGFGGGIVF